jgi:hypothetical protein
VSTTPKTTLSLSDDELRALYAALTETLEGIDGDYSDEHALMDRLRDRIRAARRRLARAQLDE